MSSCVNRTAVIHEPLPEVFEWSIIVWMALSGCFGFLCNVTAIVAILKSHDLQKQGSTKLTLNLLLSSAINCCGFMVLHIGHFVDGKRINTEKMTSGTWKVLLSTAIISTSLHMYSTTVLSVTRLIAMLRPVLYRWLMSRLQVSVLLLLVWGLPIILALPAYFGILGEVDPKTLDFVKGCDRFSVAKTVDIFFIFVVPGVTPFVMYVIMFAQVFQARKAMNANPASRRNEIKITQWQSGITRALLVTVMVHAIFWVPHQLYHILSVFYRDAYASAIIHALLIIQFIMDPMILMAFAQDYRNAGINFLRSVFSRVNGDEMEMSNAHVSSTHMSSSQANKV